MKKVFIGVLAALMLVAFTACEQEPIDMNGYVPSALSIQYNGTGVLVGQELNPADFSGVVTYKNGKTAEYTGTYTLPDTQNNKYKADLNVVSAAIISEVSSSSANVASASCYVPAYVPEEIVVDVTSAVKTVETDSSATAVPTTGLVVTAKYNGGQEMPLDATYIKASVTSLAYEKEDVVVTVAVADDYSTAWSGVKVKTSADWKIDVVAAAVDHDDITGIKTVTLADSTAKVFFGDNVLDKSLYKVTATDGTNDWTLDESEFTVLIAGGTDNAGNINAKTGVKVYIQSTANAKFVKEFAAFSVTDPVVAIRVGKLAEEIFTEDTTFDETTDAVTRYSAPAVPTGYTVQTQTASEAAKENGTWTSLSQATSYYFDTPVLNGSGTTQQVNLCYDSENGETYKVAVTFTFKEA